MTKPMQCFDWNAVSIGSDCVVNGFLQFHSFENMTLTVKKTQIRDGCTVTFGATIMGGAVIENNSTLMPLSMTLKEMNLLTATYEGSPVEMVRAAPQMTSEKRVAVNLPEKVPLVKASGLHALHET